MEKFKELVSLCKASVTISVNEHRDVYESVERYIGDDAMSEIEKEVLDEMIRTDTLVKVQAYHKTPIGFFLVYHYDIDKCIDMAIEAVKSID